MAINRDTKGTESFEVAIAAGIVFCLSIGAITIIGPQLSKVFNDENSPITVSKNIKNSSNSDDIDGENSRYNMDKSLISSKLITKAHSDKSITSSATDNPIQDLEDILQGESIYNKTYNIDDPAALEDGDPNTTGNKALDEALIAKKSSETTMNNATSTNKLVEILENRTDNISQQIANNKTILEDMDENLSSLNKTANQVNMHLDLLKELKMTTSGISENIHDALEKTNNINTEIINKTNENLTTGQGLLDLNQRQKAAYKRYVSLSVAYNNGWRTCSGCSTDSKGNTHCYSYTYNVSGISPGDISAALNLANMLLAELNGKRLALESSICELKNKTAALEQEMKLALKETNAISNSAKETLINAFKDSSVFSNCESIQSIIAVAQKSLGQWGNRVENVNAAQNAIKLLEQAGNTYENYKTLEAQTTQLKNNLMQKQEILTSLNSDACHLNLTKQLIDSSNIEKTLAVNNKILKDFEPEILLVSNELEKVNIAIDSTDELRERQLQNIEVMNQKLVQAEIEASEMRQVANEIYNNASLAYDNAVNKIRNIFSQQQLGTANDTQ
ncbi:MAG: hypothetical protein AB7V50_06220 [Vampirovibrionia bacterium]